MVQKLYHFLISVFSGGDSFLCGVPGIRPCVFCCRHGAVRSGKTTAGVPKVFTELKCRCLLTARKPHFVIHSHLVLWFLLCVFIRQNDSSCLLTASI